VRRTIPMGGIRMFDGVAASEPLGSALRAGVLSFASPKESSQRKGDPKVGAGYAGPLRYSKSAGAAELGATPLRQSSPLIRRFLRCSAPLMGTRKASRLNVRGEKLPCCGRLLKKAKNEFCWFGVDVFPGPLEGAEQRRSAGGRRLALFEPQASLASRPVFRVAQGTPVGGTDPGSPFLCLLSFGEAKESETPRKGGTLPSINENVYFIALQ